MPCYLGQNFISIMIVETIIIISCLILRSSDLQTMNTLNVIAQWIRQFEIRNSWDRFCPNFDAAQWLSGVIDTEIRHTKFHFFWQTLWVNTETSYQLWSTFKYPTRLLHAFQPLYYVWYVNHHWIQRQEELWTGKKTGKEKKF